MTLARGLMMQFPSCSSNTTYILTGNARKRWLKFWLNGASGACLIFLAAFPIFAALTYWIIAGPYPTQQSIAQALLLLVSTIPIILAIIVCWLAITNEHLRRGLIFAIEDGGLRVKAVTKERMIYWHKILDVFPTTGQEFVICTKNNGNFYFPKDMESSAELYLEIHKRLPKQDQSEYDLALCIPDSWRNQIILAGTALGCAIVLPYLRSILMGQDWPPPDIVLLLLVLLLVCIGYFFLFKTPIVLRIGTDNIFVRDHLGDHYLNWNQVTSVRNFTRKFTLISTTKGTWIIPWLVFSSGERDKQLKAKNNNEIFKVREQFLALSANKRLTLSP